MKKSTIVMIATAVVVWAAILGVVIAVASGGELYRHEEIVLSDSAPKVCKDIEPFSTISFTSYGIIYSNAARIGIMQCDTVTKPRIIYNKDIENNISYEIVQDSLKIIFQQTDRDINSVNVTSLKGASPLTIMMPSSAKEVSIRSIYNQPIPLLITGVNAKKISMESVGYTELYSCIVDSLRLNYSNYHAGYQIKLNDSKIGYLAPKLNGRWSTDFSVVQDSAFHSTVGCLDWSFYSEKEPQIELDRITVDNLKYDGEAIRLVVKNEGIINQITSK
ncbi:MAG: hypothetical protein K2M11_10465 [Paramuribaculum sp.]|nr:hypothetical protein [Paramuribaculum sp.]